jgi:hypothetical protein
MASTFEFNDDPDDKILSITSADLESNEKLVAIEIKNEDTSNVRIRLLTYKSVFNQKADAATDLGVEFDRGDKVLTGFMAVSYEDLFEPGKMKFIINSKVSKMFNILIMNQTRNLNNFGTDRRN